MKKWGVLVWLAFCSFGLATEESKDLVAQGDLDGILEYIALRDSVDAALRVCENIVNQVETLIVHPERCRIPPELKRVGVFEYRELIVSACRIFSGCAGRASES